MRKWYLRIVSDGIHYACGLTLVGLLSPIFLTPGWACHFTLLAVFCLYFFRDPERVASLGRCDGISSGRQSRFDARMGAGETRVSIFLNIFDVHVNRTPIPGKITEVQLSEGQISGGEPRGSFFGKRAKYVSGGRWQRHEWSAGKLPGLIARRIVCYKHPGEPLPKVSGSAISNLARAWTFCSGPSGEPQ